MTFLLDAVTGFIQLTACEGDVSVVCKHHAEVESSHELTAFTPLRQRQSNFGTKGKPEERYGLP